VAVVRSLYWAMQNAGHPLQHDQVTRETRFEHLSADMLKVYFEVLREHNIDFCDLLNQFPPAVEEACPCDVGRCAEPHCQALCSAVSAM